MAETVGIKELSELIVGLKDLAVTVKQVFKDGKVDLSDLALVVGLIAQSSDLVAAVQGVDQIPAEFKDLSGDEVQTLITELLTAYAAFKAA